MGQSISKKSWTSSSDINNLYTTNSAIENHFHNSCLQTINNNNQSLKLLNSETTSAILPSSNHFERATTALESDPTKHLSQTHSSPNLVIRIKLTKMQNNNNIKNLNPSDSTNDFSIASRSSNSGGGIDDEIYSGLDNNNLNIKCDTHSIINFSISNSICDSPINITRTASLSNNLNVVSTTDANSNSINCLNVIENQQREKFMVNNLNIPNSALVVDRYRQTTNINPMNVNILPQTTADHKISNSNISPTNSLNLTSLSTTNSMNVNILPQTTADQKISNSNSSPTNSLNLTSLSTTAASSISCIDNVLCQCTEKDDSMENSEENCNTGQSSLCAHSSFKGDQHCCRPKKNSSAYPTKLRCCQCACIPSAPREINKDNCNVASSSKSNDLNSGCICRNDFSANISCQNSNSTSSVTAVNRTKLLGSPLSRQKYHPTAHSHNLIVLSVSNGQHIIVDSHHTPRDFRWLPVLCSSAGDASGPLGASGVGSIAGPMVHSQADYSHCLVPDLEKITNCSFYWGKMDRYEAERLLEGKPEGTFLLRDSAQEEYLFSVTFRKYGRSLHARIEQLGHKFSFDCHDPGVFTASTITGLLEHYKDPSCVMFFEPMLTIPLHRNFTFSLQQLCRATIVSYISYDEINELQLPSSLKAYLKEYHYKYKVRETPLDETLYSCP